ncbi:MAG: hypothetical protein IJ459_04550 [Clostridia bacterium]|nr:hypothetical protein [Clostridia bacterium]
MIKVVLTIMDDVCLANGKDVNATHLLEVAKTYGKVTNFDDEVAGLKAEYQKSLDNVVAQNKALEAQNINAEELVWLNFIRERKAIETEGFVKQIDARDKVIEEVRADSQKRAEQLALFAEQLKEMAT